MRLPHGAPAASSKPLGTEGNRKRGLKKWDSIVAFVAAAVAAALDAASVDEDECFRPDPRVLTRAGR